MTAWPSFDVTISLFSQSVQKYYNNFACARFYFERIGNKCFHRGEGRGIDLLPYKEERYISSFWNEKTRVTLPSSPVFCHAKYRGGVTQGRRGWKIPAVEVTESGLLFLLLIVDVMGGSARRVRELNSFRQSTRYWTLNWPIILVRLDSTIRKNYVIFSTPLLETVVSSVSPLYY